MCRSPQTKRITSIGKGVWETRGGRAKAVYITIKLLFTQSWTPDWPSLNHRPVLVAPAAAAVEFDTVHFDHFQTWKSLTEYK